MHFILESAKGNIGKIVAIDIETGALSVADTPVLATDKLYEQHPDAQPWVIRIGHPVVYRFGSRSLKKPLWCKDQVIDVADSEADPLVGMSLLYGFKLQMDVIERGIVRIESLKQVE